MIEEYGIVLMQMMENAGRNLADLAQALLEDDVIDRSVLVLVGRGNRWGRTDSCPASGQSWGRSAGHYRPPL